MSGGSFEEHLDRAFARAKNVLLAEHEIQIKRASGGTTQCWASGGSTHRLDGDDRTSVNAELNFAKINPEPSSDQNEIGNIELNFDHRVLQLPSQRSKFSKMSKVSKQSASLVRIAAEPVRGVAGARRRCSMANPAAVRTLSSIIEAATQGLSNTEVRSRSFMDRIMETIRRSAWESVMAVVIFLNTVTLGLSTDLAPQWVGWFVIECLFALIFFIEMLLKVCRKDGPQRYFFGPGWRWNVFEFALVVLAILEVATGLGHSAEGSGVQAESETGTYVVFRIFRLARIARILRMSRLEVFSDLLMMIHGALGGVRTFLWSVVLITLPLYSVALVLTDALKDPRHDSAAADMFQNVGTSFFTLFRCMVGNDCTTADGRPIFVLLTHQFHWVFGILYCLVMLVMTFGLFNVIVAIYVENIVAAAKFNDAHTKRQRLWDTEMFTDKITQMVDFLWRLHLERVKNFGEAACPAKEVAQLEINMDFFTELRSDPEFQEILRDLDIADEDQLDLFDTLDVDGGGTIDLEELVTGIAKLRGDARRSDIVSVGLILRSLQISTQEFECKVMHELKQHGNAITALQRQRAIDQKQQLASAKQQFSEVVSVTL